jgi:glycerol-3-phosphate acyltransferase PlsX
LSNGEEKGKGRALEKAAYNLLEEGPTEFVGNVEGRDIATDRADVIVTDGFTGNIFLKTTEGVAKLVTRYFREAMSDLPDDVQEVALAAIASVQQRLDYETYGGAQLLGVKSVVVIAHGNSSRIAISNALALAKESADHDLAKRIADQLS